VDTVILNWLRPLWEGDQEVVKRSGRDEPIWVVINICMATTLGISLYSYLYLKLARMICLSYFLYFLFNKIRVLEDRTASAQRQGGGVGKWPNNVYTRK
jgi:hypothetical protein